MKQKTTVTITAKILNKNEQVINVWLEEKTYNIAIRRDNGEVYISRIVLDNNGNPRLENSNPLIITFGNGEIESEINTEGQGSIKVITA